MTKAFQDMGAAGMGGLGGLGGLGAMKPPSSDGDDDSS